MGEIAALNFAKFRQAQAQLGECEERADLNEQALAKYKAKERAASLAPMQFSSWMAGTSSTRTCTNRILEHKFHTVMDTLHDNDFFKIQYDKIVNAYAGKGTTMA